MDFLSLYNNLVIGIELKASNMQIGNSKKLPEKLCRRWKTSKKQVVYAQNTLRKSNNPLFKKPISMALMIVSGKIRNKANKTDLKDYREQFVNMLEKLRPKSQFLAIYMIPEELQENTKRPTGKDSKGQTTYIPFYGFVVRTRLRGAGESE